MSQVTETKGPTTKAIFKLEAFTTSLGDTIQQFTLIHGEEPKGREHPKFIIHTKLLVEAPDRTGKPVIQPLPFNIPIDGLAYGTLEELIKDLDGILKVGRDQQIKLIKEHQTRQSLTAGLTQLGIPAR